MVFSIAIDHGHLLHYQNHLVVYNTSKIQIKMEEDCVYWIIMDLMAFSKATALGLCSQ